MDVVYSFRSRKQAETVAKILPRIVAEYSKESCYGGWHWKVEPDNNNWAVIIMSRSIAGQDAPVRQQVRDIAEGWCRGYMYARRKG